MAVRGESVQVGPWTGGVNYAVPAEDLGPTELFSMENMRVGIGGEVSKRGGIALYNSSAISGTPKRPPYWSVSLSVVRPGAV